MCDQHEKCGIISITGKLEFLYNEECIYNVNQLASTLQEVSLFIISVGVWHNQLPVLLVHVLLKRMISIINANV